MMHMLRLPLHLMTSCECEMRILPLPQSVNMTIGSVSASLSWCTGCARKTPSRSWFRSTLQALTRKSRTPFPLMPGMRIHVSGRSTQGSYTHGISRGAITAMVRHPLRFLVVMRRNTRISAALVMYQRARKLATLAVEPSNFVPMAELQLEAYLGAVNALSLVDQKVAWIAIPIAAESDYLVCPLPLFQVFWG